MPQSPERKGLYDVDIAGVRLKLRSGREEAIVNKLAAYVDKKVLEALPATKSGSVQNAALLACLNMAEEMFELKRQLLERLEQFEKKTHKVLNELESSRGPRGQMDN